MRWQLSFLILCFVFAAINAVEQQKPQGFSAQSYEDDDYDSQAQTPVGYRARLYDYSIEEDQSDEQPRQTYQTRKPQQTQSYNIKKDRKRQKIDEEVEEEEEPDRLSLLLLKSGFKCDGRTTGYYADETLGCEVFHYCQENQKHSWICPEGFNFHQVHLICMPPSGENICEESSKYHIVNEYLYKPINVEEHQTKPNISLKYSERYYPDTYYHDERPNYQEERVQSHRTPIQVGFNSQQRKIPTPSTTPLPYRFAPSSTPQQTVYRSPEDINISLQQRRPQTLFLPSTPRYTDEDYTYEK